MTTTAASRTTRTEFQRRPVARTRAKRLGRAHRVATSITLATAAIGVVDVGRDRAWGARRRRARSRGSAAATGRRSAGAKPGCGERLLAVDLGARAVLDGHALGRDRAQDAVAVPAGRERSGLDERVEAVEGVLGVARQAGGCAGRACLREALGEPERVGCARGVPLRQLAQAHADQRGRHLVHAPVGAEAVDDPAERGAAGRRTAVSVSLRSDLPWSLYSQARS